MAFIDEMLTLRKDIESGKQIRTRRLKEIKEDLSAFTKEATRKRKEDFKVLTEEVNKFITDLKRDVKATQKENQAKQRELKKMLTEARATFWGKKKPAKKAAEKGVNHEN